MSKSLRSRADNGRKEGSKFSSDTDDFDGVVLIIGGTHSRRDTVDRAEFAADDVTCAGSWAGCTRGGVLNRHG